MIVSEKLKKLEKENAKLKAKLKEAQYINTGIMKRWKRTLKNNEIQEE